MHEWFDSAGASSDLISINRFLDRRTFVTHSGGVGMTLYLGGIDPECLSAEQLDAISAQVMQAQRMIPEEVTLYQIIVKGRGAKASVSGQVGREESPTERARRDFLATRPFCSIALYWTLYVNPPAGKKRLSPQAFDQAVSRNLHVLRRCAANVLASVERVGGRFVDCDELTALYGYIANLDIHLCPKRLASPHGVARQIARTPLHWKEDGLTIGRRFAKLFSLQRPPSFTKPNLFGELLALDANLILIAESQRETAQQTRKRVSHHQTFRDLFRQKILTTLAHAHSKKEAPVSAEAKISDNAVEGLAGILGDLENGLGYSSFSLIGLLHSEDKAELDAQLAQVHRIFGASDAAILEEGRGSLSAFMALFPGAVQNGRPLNVRRMSLRDDHVARLSHCFAPFLGHPWSNTLEDEALAVFETRMGTPFHYDAYARSLRGLFLLGEPGSGKSFTANFLVDQEAKYGGFIFIFDVGGSYVETVHAHGGRVVRFGLDGPRLNPFSLTNTPENHYFAFRLVRTLLLKAGAVIGPERERSLAQQVAYLFELPAGLRRLRHLILPPDLQPYLSKWIEDGIYSRIFDNVEDELELARIVSFDFEGISGEREQADLMEPILSWIRWRINTLTHDKDNLNLPKLEVYDELWRHIGNDDTNVIDAGIATAKTGRKHMAGVIFATQDASDLGAYFSKIRNTCPDTMFLGTGFQRSACTELFHLNATQIDLLGTLRRGEALLQTPDFSKVIQLNVDAESRWRYSTHPQDRARRTAAIEKYGRELAFKELALTASK